ncbi:MAG: DUF4331 domain-containing protein [Leptolyngbyaceae cyanobacterium SM1_1_3]|nr:DUF4331 domain-containing protein [Leptolyngbyaceae cyanobacterium SM1_1_3]NJN04832.1 DUF4331 domain-containing protein [Leptolyngbyaceae cyanobacterium RM1_1_2]NJO11406.1 DUF4331 domain-containing protein [Leptolyngbyaceae cyanobacterium SL_1_1]
MHRRKPSLNSLRHLSRKTLLRLGSVVLGAALAIGGTAHYLQASDHDDGEIDLKGRALNLTDLYVFREGDQNPQASTNDLVLVMNTNPRSLARQQYYFSTNARYEFNITRVADKDATPTGRADMTLRFEFGPPNRNQEQEVTITTLANGRVQRTAKTTTTALSDSTPNVRQVNLGSGQASVFAGLREDPFFFDVEQYFRVRAGALGIGPAVGFRPPAAAVDFAAGYNVNTIVMRVPKRLLQGNTQATTFDVWTTISVLGDDVDAAAFTKSAAAKDDDDEGDEGPSNGGYIQVERLARPAINEGLLFTNALLNALNSVGPDFEAAALKGQQPAARIAAPIIAEASRTLMAIGNDQTRTNALLGAFLPDVMRIDTTGPSGYANALNAKGSPIRGRMLTDDVVDITLSVLTNGAIATDNVSYAGTPGNPSQGHDPLEASFPYLALPN